jgi:hypothetical protein
VKSELLNLDYHGFFSAARFNGSSCRFNASASGSTGGGFRTRVMN